MNADDALRWVFPAVALAAVLVEVVAGPLLLGSIRYRVSPDATIQYLGGEIVTLVAAVAMMVSAFQERSSLFTLLGAGAGLYLVYTMVTVIFGQDYHRYDGNADRWFLLFTLITLTTIPVVARKLSLLLHAAAPAVGWLQRGTLIALGLMFALLWLSAIAKNAQAASPEYVADPSLFWLIKFLDLAVVIPGCLICAAQWTGSYRIGGMVALAFTFWMLLAIAGMQIATAAAHAPTDSLVVAVLMAAAGLWTGCCVWLAARRWELVPV